MNRYRLHQAAKKRREELEGLQHDLAVLGFGPEDLATTGGAASEGAANIWKATQKKKDAGAGSSGAPAPGTSTPTPTPKKDEGMPGWAWALIGLGGAGLLGGIIYAVKK